MAVRNNTFIEGDLIVKGKIYSSVEEQNGGSSITLASLNMEKVGSTLKSLSKLQNGHYHVLVEYETNGVHHGASVDIHPYNNSICLSYFLIGNDIQTGYLDEEGYLVLSIPAGVEPTNIECHYFQYN
jgi:hypothetical protein